MSRDPSRPTAEDLIAARGKSVPDVIAPGLKVLFCGINPSLYTAAVGHHFARPGNRFWPALYMSGITPRLFSPSEESELLVLGYGITNVVNKATAAASELTEQDYLEGEKILTAKVRTFSPKVLAILGVGAYRAAFKQPAAQPGLQNLRIGTTAIWILPNPSGLNANYRVEKIASMIGALKVWVEQN